MASEVERQKIVALDIGTNKIATIVAEVGDAGELEIIGIGTHQSRGLKKGVVVNIESTVQSIQRAVEEAELMAGCGIESVYAGIAGSHIKSLNSHGIVAIRDREEFLFLLRAQIIPHSSELVQKKFPYFEKGGSFSTRKIPNQL